MVSLAFQGLRADQMLWPMSGQTLRSRFKQILTRLRLDQPLPGLSKSFDMGSLRGGGATWTLQACEDAELVRRRGRWVSQRNMEIYIQETSAVQVLALLQPIDILYLAAAFPAVFAFVKHCQALRIPSKMWHKLWMIEAGRNEWE